MKLAIGTVLAVFGCSFFVFTSALHTCEQYDSWNIPAFHCKNGKECIPETYECDSVLDCKDFSDEDHCEEQHRRDCDGDFEGKVLLGGEPLQQYQCKDDMCILGCQRCDGTIDCADGSDESSCSGEVRPPC